MKSPRMQKQPDLTGLRETGRKYALQALKNTTLRLKHTTLDLKNSTVKLENNTLELTNTTFR